MFTSTIRNVSRKPNPLLIAIAEVVDSRDTKTALQIASDVAAYYAQYTDRDGLITAEDIAQEAAPRRHRSPNPLQGSKVAGQLC